MLNAADDTNVDIFNSGGSGVAQLGFRVAGSEKVTISSGGNITTTSDGIALKLDGSSNTTRGIFIRNTGGSAHGYLHTDGNLKLIAEDSGKSISLYTADDGTGTARLSINSSGVVNISNLSASSDVQTDGSKNLITSSDKRLKNDIGELTAGLDIISNLKPHYFSWKSDITNTQQLGFFAQDVYEFLPEAAPREEITNEDGSTDYKWGFNGRPIIAALVAAVKELKSKVETLENS